MDIDKTITLIALSEVLKKGKKKKETYYEGYKPKWWFDINSIK